MERQLTLRVIVERPPGDVDFGIQEGHGLCIVIPNSLLAISLLTFQRTLLTWKLSVFQWPDLTGGLQGNSLLAFLYLICSAFSIALVNATKTSSRLLGVILVKGREGGLTL